ncbi:MAG: C25 family cysteine peptidase [Candidatus Eisenbacteria bacterium]
MVTPSARSAVRAWNMHALRAVLGTLLCAGLLSGLARATEGGALDRDDGPGLSEFTGSASDEQLASSPSSGNFAATIKLFSEEMAGTGAAPELHRFLYSLPSLSESDGCVRRLVAVPDGSDPSVGSLTLRSKAGDLHLGGSQLADIAWVENVGRVRDQAVATVAFDLAALERAHDATSIEGVELLVTFDGAAGPVSRSAGPLSRACESAIQNYEAPANIAAWRPPAPGGAPVRAGTVAYCASVADCAIYGVDVLFVAAEQLASTPALYGYATHHASYLGLNVGLVSMADIGGATPEAVRQFIQDVYDTQSAEHFGDGRLGFVVLVGDAYADDNQTVMIPVYNGYGGSESASDHYYACVSGDDDLEDVMLGRLSVGNLEELAAVLSKSVSYMPLTAGEAWHERILLIGGLFYTIKEDYVALFDQYDDLIPDDLTVDRIYRHDYGTTQSCALDVVDAFNDGYLFVNFNGDGWISTWDHTLSTSHIDLMQNSQRLPIVLSMACSTGWLDNITQPDASGSYDCLAEQLVYAQNGGAVACLAAPRTSDGGIFRSFTKQIWNAAYEEHCIFTGELVATAKLLHLQAGGNASYTRQFALFGDPSLVFGLEFQPTGLPDVTAKPHQTVWTPSELTVGDDLAVSVGVSNQSDVAATNVLVRLSGQSDAGSYELETTVPSVGPWATEFAELVVQTPLIGSHLIDISVDPDDSIQELLEDNNAFSHATYVYPNVPGFPVDIGFEIHSPCVVQLEGTSRHILIPDEDARLWSIDSAGAAEWTLPATWGASSYGPEIAAAAGDLDGDGTNEVVTTKFLGVVALDAAGQELWTANTSDPVGHPVLADADSDGDLDVIVTARAYFGGSSSVLAIDEHGFVIWTHPLPQDVDVTTAPVAGDFDLDGRIDIAYGTSEGTVEAISCATIPPSLRWGPFDTGGSPVAALALADVDSDGLLEVIAAGESVRCIGAESGFDAGWDVDLGTNVVSLAVSDTDGDGVPEVLVGSSGGTVGLVAAGSLVWSRAVSGTPGSSSSIADIDGDGAPEILLGTDGGYLYVLTPEGLDYVSPIPVGGACLTPFVADLTGDGALEVAVCSSEGLVYAFSFGGAPEQHHAPEWLGIGRAATRTAVLEQPFWGTVDGNLVLSGNFHIVDDLVVPSGSTLTVAPEVRLAFSLSSLKIEGTLHAPGVPGGEIIMTSSPLSRERWGGIEVKPGGSATMTSCVVTDATLGIEANGAALTLVDCEFTGNGDGAKLENCSLYADGSSFSQSDGIGLDVNGGSGTVADCLMSGNGTGGVKCQYANAYTFARSTFSGTTNGHGAQFLRSSHARVDSCSFGYNSENGVLAKQSSPTFESCFFTGNGLYGLECERLSFPAVNWCTIVGNRIGVVCRASSFPNLGSAVDVSTGFNAIYGNQQAAIANQNTEPAPVYAKRNWWGSAPPAGRIFMGYVIYTPWLDAIPDPNTYATGIEDAPSAYGLSPNWPNPFNPVTSLAMTAPPYAGPVLVTVHDASGRLVRTLHAGPAAPGTHELVWDGRDDVGNRVASGVYFARMAASDFGAVRKMLLLK